jgi:aminopeptidase N
MNRLEDSVRALVAMWLVCAGCVVGVAQSKPAAQHVFGNPQVEQYAPSRTYHVENYKVAVRIDMAHGDIYGDEIVTLRPLQAGLKNFYLDSDQLEIDSVALMAEQPKKLAFHLDGAKLWVDLDRAFGPSDTLNVHVVYHGHPQGRAFPDAGLSFIRPDAAMPDRPLEVWSYGWPQNNHFWFPCWDYPNDKSTSEIVVTVPEPLSVVSNGALVKETHSQGLATYDWVEHVPHSVYLVSIAVGPWKKYSQHYGAKTVDYYVPPGTDEATALRSFGLTPEMMAFYSKVYGVDYPYEKYAQVAAHGFGGGTENISATSLAETTLHDAVAEQDYPSMDLVSHELAHQWFGDLITEKGWEDAWLSEGFATFSAALYRGHHDSDDAFRYQIFQDQQTAAREDSTRYRRPIVDRHYAKPWEILDRTTYQKGAAVLDMLRDVMNDSAEKVPSADEPFFRMLQTYLNENRASNVDTKVLIDTIRKTTGRDLGWFFDEWIYKGGYPNYQVSTAYDPVKREESVTVKQTQAIDAVTPLFDMPIHLVFHSAGGRHEDKMVRVRNREETFHFAATAKPQWVDFDPDDHIFKTLSMDEPIDALIARGERDERMMSRLWAASRLGQSQGDDRDAAVKALETMLGTDSFYGVRVSCAQSLGELGMDEAKTTLLGALKQTDSHVRTAAVEALGRWGYDQEIETALIQALQHDGSYAVRAAAARDLGQMGGTPALDALKEAARARPSRYVMVGVLEGLSHFKEAEAMVAEQAKTGETDEVRTSAARWLRTMQARPRK